MEILHKGTVSQYFWPTFSHDPIISGLFMPMLKVSIFLRYSPGGLCGVSYTAESSAFKKKSIIDGGTVFESFWNF